MIPASFSVTGSATTLSAIGLSGSGLSLSGPDGNGKYTLSGTPTTDVAVTLTAEGIDIVVMGFINTVLSLLLPPVDPILFAENQILLSILFFKVEVYGTTILFAKT